MSLTERDTPNRLELKDSHLLVCYPAQWETIFDRLLTFPVENGSSGISIARNLIRLSNWPESVRIFRASLFFTKKKYFISKRIIEFWADFLQTVNVFGACLSPIRFCPQENQISVNVNILK